MQVAITGSQGDLGSALSRTNPGHKLRLIDRVAPPESYGGEYRQADICDLPALTQAFQGCDAVIHLAALRNPFMAPAETVFHVNTQGAYNMTLAAEAIGIHRVVYASSICYYGYLFRNRLVSPPYFPIDELTPPHPEDSYSLSKLVGEEIMQAFVQRSGASVVSLRFPYLMPFGATGGSSSPWDNADWRVDAETALSWWTYVDLDDAAHAVWLSLNYLNDKHSLHTRLNIGADDTHTTMPTRELLARQFPEVTDLRFGDAISNDPCTSLYSNAKAKKLLGFMPSSSVWRTKLGQSGDVK